MFPFIAEYVAVGGELLTSACWHSWNMRAYSGCKERRDENCSTNSLDGMHGGRYRNAMHIIIMILHIATHPYSFHLEEHHDLVFDGCCFHGDQGGICREGGWTDQLLRQCHLHLCQRTVSGKLKF